MNRSNQSRRKFLLSSIKAGAVLPLFSSPFLSTLKNYSKNSEIKPKSAHPLKILILGGTSFLGPHQIAYALGRGHSISIFTRGKTKPTIYKRLFKNVEHLIGDRNDNLEALKGRKWDAVIDNSGHKVEWTRDTAQLLKDNVKYYLFTSSTGVYFPYRDDNIEEDRELVLQVPATATEDQKVEYDYGVMKSLSEIEAKNAFGAKRTIVVRPTYMIGPADQFDRFVHWPVRLKRGGNILIPGKSNDPVQYIDVRDVAEWMIRLLESGKAGTYNAVGPASHMSMPVFVHGVHAAFSSAVDFVQIDDYDFLASQNIYFLIPWVVPTGDHYGCARMNNSHAKANGLTFRPLARTILDIDEWWNSEAVTEERRKNLTSSPDSIVMKEKAVIENWKKR